MSIKRVLKLMTAGILGIGLLQFGRVAMAQGEITMDTQSVEFGAVWVHAQQQVTKAISFTNHSSGSLGVRFAMENFQGAVDFQLDSVNKTTIAPGETITVNVILSADPSNPGHKEGILRATFSSPTNDSADIEAPVVSADVNTAKWSGGPEGCNAAPGDTASPTIWFGFVSVLVAFGFYRLILRKNSFSR